MRFIKSVILFTWHLKGTIPDDRQSWYYGYNILCFFHPDYENQSYSTRHNTKQDWLIFRFKATEYTVADETPETVTTYTP